MESSMDESGLIYCALLSRVDRSIETGDADHDDVAGLIPEQRRVASITLYRQRQKITKISAF